MTGIPSTDSAGRALSGVTRVLLRTAVLVGLVVCGWLLGSGVGLADEADADGGAVTQDWVHVALAHDEHDSPAPAAGVPAPSAVSHSSAARQPAGDQEPGTTPRTGDGLGGLLAPLDRADTDAVAPVGAVLRLPAELAGADVVGQVVEPLARPVVEAVAEPVTAQLRDTATQPSGRPDTPQTASPGIHRAPPSAPVLGSTVAPVPPPVVAAPATTATTPGDAANLTGALTSDQLTGPSQAVGKRPASAPVTVIPLATAPSSCPPGSAGANTVVQAGHAAVLADGLAGGDTGVAQHRLHTGAGGLPRCPSLQPSTSPD